jgi:hypothetical protein
MHHRDLEAPIGVRGFQNDARGSSEISMHHAEHKVATGLMISALIVLPPVNLGSRDWKRTEAMLPFRKTGII